MSFYSNSSTKTRHSSGPVLRSLSPSGRLNTTTTTTTTSSSAAFASSTATAFSNTFSHPHHHHHHHDRASSPTRVNLLSPSTPSIRFSTSPNRSISAHPVHRPHQKKSCMCSPTNHPGSFRCSLHKARTHPHPQTASPGPYQSNRLFARRSAMTNSLVRIGTVEGDLVKRALAALIRPSSHHQRRRGDFQPTKSRLSSMSSS